MTATIRKLRLAAGLGAALLASACSYSYETNVLGYRSAYSVATPGMEPAPPASTPPAARCWVQPHYNHAGYWVPGHYRSC